MTERPDLGELVGEDVSDEELERLRRADRFLRSVPPPPTEVPPSLTRAVTARSRPRALPPRRRVLGALALAAALSALFFSVGRWAAGDDFDERAVVPMEATRHAEGASALLRLSEREENGNWRLRLEVEGLLKLPEGGYYVLWLAKDGEYGGTCGTFAVGEGTTTVEMNASYRLKDFDAWVVTAQLPGRPPDAEPAWLLQAEISV